MKFEQVFEEELAELGKRRALQSKETIEGEAAPAAADNLVGLCFSGGGIRSATFNLGIARGLHRWGLLKWVDYLSTVSGGGYVGSCVANHYRLGKEDLVLASWDEEPQGEPAGITRLRGLGHFLTPTGSPAEWLQAFVPLVCGMLWNFAVFVVVAAGLATIMSFALEGGRWVFAFPHGVATAAAVGVTLLISMFSVLGSRTPPKWLLVSLVGVTALVGVIDALPWVLERAGAGLVAFELTAVGSLLIALAGSGALSKVPAALYVPLARVVALLLAIVLPASLFIILLLHFEAEPASPTLQYEQFSLLAVAAVFLFVDFNRTSLHGFYKERLGDTFLLGDPPKLSAFAGKPGPLHLVNVALNIPGERDPAVRNRLADFFTFSCLHAGGPRTTYVPVRSFEKAKRDFTLASAVAISGAAAAPNMGSYSGALLRPIMTMLNVRMGYWAPNPQVLAAGASGWTPRLPYLFKEMSGALSIEGKLVNLSDGGHLENLGAFELLRRKCKLIIIGDGEADPSMSLGAMASLIRYARIDLDAKIDIDLDDIRVGENGFSTKHAALGTVEYANGSIGRILYLKSSLTGHEPPDVLYYKDVNPDFPHESTANQWFDDDQFDAYLALGEEVIDSLFQQLGYKDPDEAQIDVDTIEQRLATLNQVLSPTSRSRSGQLTGQLERLQKALMREELDAYRRQLIPTMFSKDIPAERLHSLVPIVMMQLQLMENAVEQLGLVDIRNREALANRGWMNTFARWAGSEAFQRLVLVCLPSFGANLSQFMDVALDLGTHYLWAEHPDAERFPHSLLLLENNPGVARDHADRGFITGLAEYRDEGDCVIVERLVIRLGFEGGDRIAAALAALRERYEDRNLKLDGSAAALADGIPADAYTHESKPRAWTKADEEAVLSFTRKQYEDRKRGEDPPGGYPLQAISFEFEP